MRYCFSTRDGGVSCGPFASLNLSYHVGDDHTCVAENRRRIKRRLGGSRLASARQVHGDHIFIVDGAAVEDREVDGVDALITAEPDTILLVQQADCQAVLLHDPVQQVIAAIHCGWRGSVAGVIGKTIAALGKRFGTDPGQLAAYIGPSLGPCCAEFINHRRELPSSFTEFQVRPNYFDFWGISSRQLTDAGLPLERILVSRICTSCSEHYFSYRRTCRNGAAVTGRHGSAICL